MFGGKGKCFTIEMEGYNMKWNTAKTFVNQMLVCIFVYVVIAFSAIYNNVVEFHIRDFFLL